MNERVRLLVTTFAFTNRDLIPGFVPQRDRDESPKRSPLPGVEFIAKTRDVVSFDFANDLRVNDFVLVDTWHDAARKGNRWSYLVRFIFAPRNHSHLTEGFKPLALRCGNLFEKFLGENAWQIKGHVNPFISDGKAVEGLAAVSLDFSIRTPLSGASKKTVQPKYSLRIIDGNIVLIPC